VQSALLEVMAERQVSLAGSTYPLPNPFVVMATQNPLESEGVYPLPEAQLDRFLLKVTVPAPSMSDEMEIVRRMSVNRPQAEQVLSLEELISLQQAADAVFVHHAVADYAVRLVMATREPKAHGLDELIPLVVHGASPRGTLGLVAAGRALALMRGRSYVLPSDIADVTVDVLSHRLILTYDAIADEVPARRLIEQVLAKIAQPTVAPSQLEADVA
jgi:MoxR-like ATPase